MGQWATVKVYAEHLEVYDEVGRLLVRWDRQHGNKQLAINPRHYFPDLLVKWGAFAGWSKEFKDQMFPTPSFRSAYEKFLEWAPEPEMASRNSGNYEYVRTLDLALQSGQEEDVLAMDGILRQLLDAGEPFGFEGVRRALYPARAAGDEGIRWRQRPSTPKGRHRGRRRDVDDAGRSRVL